MFGKSLSVEDEVVIEATGNSAAVERILRPFAKRVVVANPRMVRAIAYARVKTDKIDAVILARLYAGGFLPEVWVADDNTQRQRRQTVEAHGRSLAGRFAPRDVFTRSLHANLIPKYSAICSARPARNGWLACRCLRRKKKRSSVGWSRMERNSDQLAKLGMTIIGERLKTREWFA
jgi:hypothetical protein